MSDRTRNTIVGITAVIGVLALAWMAFMFGSLEQWTSNTYPIHIELDNAAGITTGSRVKLSGIDIGYVDSVRFTDDTASRVEMTCRIDGSHNIPANATVTSTGSLLGGASTLAVVPVPQEPDDNAKVQFLPRDGSGRISGSVVSMSKQFTEIARDMRDSLKPQLEKFGEMSDKIMALSDQYTQVGKKLNDLLEQRSAADVDAGKADGNIYTIVARTDARLAELKTTLADIHEVLGDKTMIADLRTTVANAKHLTADASTKLDALTTRYVALADDLSKSLRDMDQLMTDARTGKGTVGKLMQDPALYNNLTDAAARLTEAIKQAQLLIQKWKAEGLPIQF